MTIKKSVEEIKQVFPRVPESEIINDLDIAQKEFIDETLYLESYNSLSGISTNTVWLLPSIFNGLKEILFYDINGNPLYKEDFQLDYEIEFNSLYFKSTTDTPLTKMPDGIVYIYVGFYMKPQPLISIASTYSLNDEHINGAVAKVYKSYYAKFPVDIMISRGVNAGEIIHNRDFNAVKYWAGEEASVRVKAKKWVNRKNDTTTGSAMNYQMAGDFVFPLRTKAQVGQTGGGILVSPGGIIPVSILPQMYSKYLKFTATNGVPIVSDYSFGWTTLPTIVYSINPTYTHPDVFTITSANSEFTNTMNPDSNNKDYHVDTWNANTIVLSFGDASGTLFVTIAELL